MQYNNTKIRWMYSGIPPPKIPSKILETTSKILPCIFYGQISPTKNPNYQVKNPKIQGLNYGLFRSSSELWNFFVGNPA